MIKNILSSWLPLAVAGTILSAVLYVSVQQSYRMSADDAVVQLAQDTAKALSGGYSVESLTTALSNTQKTDISYSLLPFIFVTDDSGKLITGSASYKSGEPSLPPQGALDYALSHGEDRLTWQPPTGERYATVIVRYNFPGRPASVSTQPVEPASGFVIAARSLSEAEGHIADLGFLVLIGWVVYLAATFMTVAAMRLLSAKDN